MFELFELYSYFWREKHTYDYSLQMLSKMFKFITAAYFFKINIAQTSS